MRPRELRIGHEDEKIQESIKTIAKERGKFSITFNGSQWTYSREWCFMENVLLSLTIVSIDTCVFFVVVTYSRLARTQIGPVPILFISRIMKFHQCTSVIVELILNFTLYCTLNAQNYAHLSSCFQLFFELNVNLNLKFKSQFRKVSVPHQCVADHRTHTKIQISRFGIPVHFV